MYRNEDLKASIEKLTKTIISNLKECLDEYIPKYKQSKFEHQFKNLFIHESDNTMSDILFENLIEERSGDIRRLDEYQEYLDVVRKDNRLSRIIFEPVGIWGSTIYSDPFDYLKPMLSRIMKSTYENDSYDNGLFLNEYGKLEGILYDNEVSITILVPIYNLTVYREFVDLSGFLDQGKLNLRRISDAEKKLLLHSIGYYDTRMFLMGGSNFMLELLYKEPKQFTKISSKLDELSSHITNIIDIISALRLTKAGVIGPTTILSKSAEGSLRHSVHTNFDLGSISRSSDSYFFEETDLEILTKITKSLKQMNNKNIRNAVNRYNLTYEREHNEDKLIDLMIAYEALFSRPSESSDSTSHKLALRFARWLGTSTDDRYKHYEQMKKLYQKRNGIVHGSTDKVDSVTILKTHELIRNSIRKYLMNIEIIKNHDEFINKLDYN